MTLADLNARAEAFLERVDTFGKPYKPEQYGPNVWFSMKLGEARELADSIRTLLASFAAQQQAVEALEEHLAYLQDMQRIARQSLTARGELSLLDSLVSELDTRLQQVLAALRPTSGDGQEAKP